MTDQIVGDGVASMQIEREYRYKSISPKRPTGYNSLKLCRKEVEEFLKG